LEKLAVGCEPESVTRTASDRKGEARATQKAAHMQPVEALRYE